MSKVDYRHQTNSKLFIPTDKSNFKEMLRTEMLVWMLNKVPIWNIPIRNHIINKLFGYIDGTAFCIRTPFYADFAKNIQIGKNFFANVNCIIQAHEKVTIGDNVMCGPNVSILAVSHPIDAMERVVKRTPNVYEPEGRSSRESNAPIIIGNNVWLAAGVIICAGVTIGDNSVIGAGSVVTRDIPPNVFACGVPCRVIREITEADRVNIC